MSNDEITNLLSIVLIIMVCVLFALVFIYILLKIKTKPKNINNETMIPGNSKKGKNNTAQTVNNSYNKQSIFSLNCFNISRS